MHASPSDCCTDCGKWHVAMAAGCRLRKCRLCDEMLCASARGIPAAPAIVCVCACVFVLLAAGGDCGSSAQKLPAMKSMLPSTATAAQHMHKSEMLTRLPNQTNARVASFGSMHQGSGTYISPPVPHCLHLCTNVNSPAWPARATMCPWCGRSQCMLCHVLVSKSNSCVSLSRKSCRLQMPPWTTHLPSLFATAEQP